MSPAQLAQIRLRLDQVAQQRAQAEAKQVVQHFARVITKAVSVPNGATVAGLVKGVVASVTKKAPKTAAQRKAAQRAKNPAAAREANAKHQRASRAKGANRG